MSATLRGIPELRAKLRAVGDAGERIVRREIKRSALNIEGDAKKRVPVDTGRLRNSITHQIGEGGDSAVIGTNVSYAPFVEFGTRRARAKPFLFPAIEAERPTFYARLRSELSAAWRATGGR